LGGGGFGSDLPAPFAEPSRIRDRDRTISRRKGFRDGPPRGYGLFARASKVRKMQRLFARRFPGRTFLPGGRHLMSALSGQLPSLFSPLTFFLGLFAGGSKRGFSESSSDFSFRFGEGRDHPSHARLPGWHPAEGAADPRFPQAIRQELQRIGWDAAGWASLSRVQASPSRLVAGLAELQGSKGKVMEPGSAWFCLDRSGSECYLASLLLSFFELSITSRTSWITRILSIFPRLLFR
jgi:hypothetical protein